MSRKKKFTNYTNYPDHVIEAVARAILPDILEFWHTEEGQKLYKKCLEEENKTTN